MRARGLCAATPLSRRAIVALVGESSVFRLPLARLFQSSVVGLAHSRSLTRAYVQRSLSLFFSLLSLPVFFSFSPCRSVNFHLGISSPRVIHAASRHGVSRFLSFHLCETARLVGIFGLYSYISGLLNVLFPFPGGSIQLKISPLLRVLWPTYIKNRRVYVSFRIIRSLPLFLRLSRSLSSSSSSFEPPSLFLFLSQSSS